MRRRPVLALQLPMFACYLLLLCIINACKKTDSVKQPVGVTDTTTTVIVKPKVYYLEANSNSVAFQALVNAAGQGDTIILRNGSHYVTTPILLPEGKNGITIVGEEGSVIRKAPNSYNAAAIEITGNYNTIHHADLDGGNLPEAGIIIYGQYNTISNSKVHNCGNASAAAAGILIHNKGNPVCALNTVIGCSVYYNYMVGVSQHGHSNGIIKDNIIYENGAEGLTVDVLSHNNYIYNNTIDKNNAYNRGVGGIGIDYANGNRVDNNIVSNTYFKSGITFQNNIGGCDGTIVSNNRLINNALYGILERFTLFENTNTSFVNNTFSGNVRGENYILR